MVTAGDVVWPAEVDVINPDQVIATIDSPDGVIDMDIWITQDRGYKPAELQESYSIGEIPIDAIYTPIERVNFVVEHTRVGPMTDYDRLIIEVLRTARSSRMTLSRKQLGSSRPRPGLCRVHTG